MELLRGTLRKYIKIPKGPTGCLRKYIEMRRGSIESLRKYSEILMLKFVGDPLDSSGKKLESFGNMLKS